MAIEPIMPEELFKMGAQPLVVSMRCRWCDIQHAESFAWAILDPERHPNDPQWDGVTLSRIVTCPQCGREDDYAIEPVSLKVLHTRSLDRRGDPQVQRILGRLWDGTPIRRPSQAIAHLSDLCARMPDSAEAHRRLGNTCERFGVLDQAATAFERAVALDPDDFEAAHSLAEVYLRVGQDQQALDTLVLAVKVWGPAVKRDPRCRDYAPALANILMAAARRCLGTFTLTAAWANPKIKDGVGVNVSQADLKLVRSGHALVKLLQRDDLMMIMLSAEVIENQPTRLQLMLDGKSPAGVETVTVGPKAVAGGRQGRAQGRNQACACGSGRKFKVCCGR